jgi:ATP-dependent DNA helicase RecQ
VARPARLHLRRVTQALKDAGYAHALPEAVRRLLAGLAKDGRSEAGGIGSLSLRAIDGETLHVKLQRDWQALARTAQLRQSAAGLLLAHLTGQLPTGARGVDLLAATTLGALLAVINQRCRLAGRGASPRKAARPRLAVAARARGDPAQQGLWRCFARR